MTVEEQAKSVYAVLTDVYGKSPWTYEQVVADMKKAETDYFFVYDGKKVVGFLALQQLVGECELTNIAVKSAYQAKGYGKQLMAELKELDLPIFLEVRASNQAAQTLYARSGFEKIGKRRNYYREPLEDAVIMRRL